MQKLLIANATLVNDNQVFKADVLIENGFISRIQQGLLQSGIDAPIIQAEGLYLLPGMIYYQVHFRDPGLTHKGDLNSESRAAVAGGITSFMEMPNTNPRSVTQELLADKFKLGQEKSLANYSFYMGTSNDNLDEVLKTNPQEVCGIKIFLGASTGNMLVDNPETIEKVLELSARTGLIVTVHSEDENIIINNCKVFREKYGDELDVSFHPQLRSNESCVISTEKIIKLAQKTHGNLHILHLSTADEMKFFSDSQDIDTKKITAEVCVHHLWFSQEDYATKGAFIKWNPAIKSLEDRNALRQALRDGQLDIIATDHAPHTLLEKSEKNYFKCPSGGPLVQHALVAVLELVHQGVIDIETAITKTSHNIARRYKVDRRGFIKENYYADLVLVDMNNPWEVTRSNLLYKCGWSPFEGTKFRSKIISTIINGEIVYQDGKLKDDFRGMKLKFLR